MIQILQIFCFRNLLVTYLLHDSYHSVITNVVLYVQESRPPILLAQLSQIFVTIIPQWT